MGERISVGLVTLEVGSGWEPRRVHYDLVLASPHTKGSLHIATVAMPSDMGSFDAPRLRRMLYAPFSPFAPRIFDENTWTKDDRVCVARSFVLAPTNIKLPKEYLEQVHRHWCVGRRSEIANLRYRGQQSEDVGADLVDCEEMVRSIRFASEAASATN